MTPWNINNANAAVLKRALQHSRIYKNKSQLEKKVSQCLQANIDIDNISKWLAKNYWKLFVGHDENTTVFETQHVKLKSNCWSDYQLVVLAHELGHILVDGRSDYVEQWGRGYLCDGGRDSIIHRSSILREEVAAWDVGPTFCRSLNIYLDQSILERTRAKCIKSYCLWLIDKDGRYSLDP
jgi:hypothetical protein